MGDVILDVGGIDDAAAREGQALLVLEVRNLLRLTQIEWVVLVAVEEIVSEQARDIARRDRAIGDAAGGRHHFQHRLQPEEAAAAVADDGEIELAGKGLDLQRMCDLVGAQCQGG